MPLILNVLGGISLVVGLLALVMRFVDQTGFDFSYAFSYQAITGGVLLIAFGKLLKHVADTDANTTRMAQSLMLGGGNIRGIGDQGDGAPAPQAAVETPAVAAAPVAAEPAAPEPVAAEPAPEPEPAPAPEPAPEPEPAQTPLTATMSADPVETPAMQEEPVVAAEPPVEEAAPEEAAVADSTPVEQLEVRGYMVDVFSDGTVDVHTAEGAMRFESLSAFERELDRAAE